MRPNQWRIAREIQRIVDQGTFMSFSDIIGHQKQLTILTAALAKGRLHHAYLFVGPEGVGKRLAAVALAKAIHCSERQNDFCGQCVNCGVLPMAIIPMSGSSNPRRERKKSASSKFGNLSATQLSVVHRQAKDRDHRSGDVMNPSSQNALLKTVEEPPQESMIVLIAPNAADLANAAIALPATILRAAHAYRDCWLFAIAPWREPADAESIAALCMGSIGAAAGARQNAELIEKRKIWTGMLGAFEVAVITMGDEGCGGAGGEPRGGAWFLKWAEGWYRDLLIYSVANRFRRLGELGYAAGD